MTTEIHICTARIMTALTSAASSIVKRLYQHILTVMLLVRERETERERER
uniref:Uncharacterized protein n=1 Tax=Arion vulgaris TaxID=1028688 RepID=A0A0B7BN96_9EUPU